MNAVGSEAARRHDERGKVITFTMIAAILLGALLMLLAPAASRAELIVRADLGPVRVVYSDAQPACLRPPVRLQTVVPYLAPPRPLTPRHVCRLPHRHAHRYVWIPDRWVRIDGHRARLIEGHYVCTAKPSPHHRRGGVVIVRAGGGCADD